MALASPLSRVLPTIRSSCGAVASPSRSCDDVWRMDLEDLSIGTVVRARVLGHHVPGMSLTLLPPVPPGIDAWANLPAISDDPEVRRRPRSEWFPPIGSDVDAVVYGFTPHGELRLATKLSELAKARGPWGFWIELTISLLATETGGLGRAVPSGSGSLNLYFPPGPRLSVGYWLMGQVETDEGKLIEPGVNDQSVGYRCWCDDPFTRMRRGSRFEIHHACVPGEAGAHDRVVGNGTVVGPR